jgi:hypothetical protein
MSSAIDREIALYRKYCDDARQLQAEEVLILDSAVPCQGEP